MKTMILKISLLSVICLLASTTFCNAQQGTVVVNQDSQINALLNIKKDMNKDDDASNRYKIQIYSGNRSAAELAMKNFSESYNDWTPAMRFETPNYKIWAGNFGTRLEADRALKQIKRNFPSAFIFKPKKESK
jgi:hypothetical protein